MNPTKIGPCDKAKACQQIKNYLNNQNTNVKKFIYLDTKTKNVNFISKNLNKAYTKEFELD